MSTIYSAIGTFLGWLDKLTGNYVVALFLFAIIVEILLLPLSVKQQKNSIRQAKLRPKEMAIRKKYAGRNDQATQQKVTMEIQELYQRENFNPMGGCLPLLIQFPIIIILYNVVVNPMKHLLGMSNEMIQTVQSYLTTAVADGGLGLDLAGKSNGTIELLSRIKDMGLEALGSLQSFTHSINGTTYLGSDAYGALEAAFEKGLPDFSVFGLNLGEIPSFKNPSPLWLVPILTFVVYYASMKITRKFTYQPTTADDRQVACSNQMMDITMPLMSVYFTFIMPAAIGVYWIFKSILTTVKQIALHKMMPVPQFTEEDYRAAERELAGKASKKAAFENIGTTNAAAKGGIAPVRSLHHIDDEDFEDTREQAELRKRLIEEAEQKAKEEREAKKNRAVPGMKETNRHEDKKSEDGDNGQKN
ncbi:MAG: YidC/Oxa1 family membrane protein insertase [Clostridia bacterium]|nr:YidC/Oxa1 family membrane protein insertase [Clostridia bacterium]